MAADLKAAMLWPDRDEGPWLIDFEFQLIAGRAECVGIQLTSARPPGAQSWQAGGKLPEVGIPLTTSVLRGLRLSEMVTEIRETNAQLAALINEQDEAQAFAAPLGMRPATARRLQRVTKVYRAAWDRGHQPTQAVAKRLNVSSGAAASLVSRARAAGLLPPTSPGKASAHKETTDGQ